MTDNAIRVQLPGGALYAPAILEAAAKTGSRSGLPKKSVSSLNAMVKASVAVLNSGSATMISLEMLVHEDSVAVEVSGKGYKSPSKKLSNELDALGAKKASSFERSTTTSAHIIRFGI